MNLNASKLLYFLQRLNKLQTILINQETFMLNPKTKEELKAILVFLSKIKNIKFIKF